MTLVVGVIDKQSDAIYLGGDSKVSWVNDDRRTRRVYTDPMLKVIRLGGDLAVGLAGDGPDTLAAKVNALRGRAVEEVLQQLARIAGGEFVVASRSPARLWLVTPEGGAEERTALGRAWAGDKGAFSTFQAKFDDFPDDDVLSRLQASMSHIIHLGKPPSVGGFAVVAAASPDREFHYIPSSSQLWPEAAEQAVVSDLHFDVALSTSFGPTRRPNPGPLGAHRLRVGGATARLSHRRAGPGSRTHPR